MIRAKKSLGQNFLVDSGVSERIVRVLHPKASETIIEIGPGTGALTGRLLDTAGRVIAVEFDRDLIPVLKEKFGTRSNFQLVESDALTVEFCDLVPPSSCARVAANLPYNISTAILQRLIARRECLGEFVLMLQKEVVERITAPPGNTERGYLTVLVEAFCEAETLFDVPPGAFRPVPKVWSSVVRLLVRSRPAIGDSEEALFRQLVSAGFNQRRKTILNNLRHAPPDLLRRIDSAGGATSLLSRAGIDSQRRAETLRLAEWTRLTGAASA